MQVYNNRDYKVVKIERMQKMGVKYRTKFTQVALKIKQNPVSDRKYTDLPCLIFFILLFLAFIGMGIYVLVAYANMPNSYNPYNPYHQLNLDQNVNNYNEGPYPYVYHKYLYAARHWQIILISVAITLALSYLYLLFIITFPKTMIYVNLVITFVYYIMYITFSFLIFKIYVIGYIFIFVTVVLALSLCCNRFWRKIKIGIVLVQISAQILIKNKFILWVPIFKLVLCLVLGYFFMYSFSAAYSVALFKSATQQNQGLQIAILSIFVIFWVVFIFVVYYAVCFIVGAVCGQWYYKTQNISHKQMLKRSYSWMIKSFGSLVFTACALIILKTIVWILTILKNGLHARTNAKGAIIKFLIMIALCLCLFLFKHIQGFIRVLNHYSVIMMSLTGQGYCQSAKSTFGLLHTQIVMLGIVDYMTKLLLAWGSTFAVGTPVMVAFCVVLGTVHQNQLLNVIGLIFAVCGMICTLIFSVFVQTVSAVFIYYSIDEKLLEFGLIKTSRFYQQAKITLPQMLQQSLLTSQSAKAASQSAKPISKPLKIVPFSMDQSVQKQTNEQNKSNQQNTNKNKKSRTNIKQQNSQNAQNDENDGNEKQNSKQNNVKMGDNKDTGKLIKQLRQKLIQQSDDMHEWKGYQQINVVQQRQEDGRIRRATKIQKKRMSKQVDMQLSEYSEVIKDKDGNQN